MSRLPLCLADDDRPEVLGRGAAAGATRSSGPASSPPDVCCPSASGTPPGPAVGGLGICAADFAASPAVSHNLSRAAAVGKNSAANPPAAIWALG